jgi:glutaconate CoA-transferase, subunit B
MSDWSASEMMIVASARQLVDERTCFVGIGLPNIAANLARRTVNPGIELVYESGVFGAVPAHLPLSIGDPRLVSNATAVTSMFELFGYYLQAGLIDVGFLGAAQIDRFGNINTTVIGEYGRPKVRLPGSGGACEIAINARRVFVILRQGTRSFVDRLDFRTTPGRSGDADHDRARGWLGSGPAVVVTQLGVYRPHAESGELVLASIHPGETLEGVREQAGWEIQVAGDVGETAAPTEKELRLIREELDPNGVYR